MPSFKKCVLCDRSRGRTLYEVESAAEAFKNRKFEIVRCHDCGLVSTQPRLSEEGLRDCYPEAYYSKDRLRLKSFLEDDVPWLRRADRLEKYSRGGSILDIGCGSGGFLGSLDVRRWQKYGVEISPVPAESARRRFNIHVFVGDLQEANFLDDQFDVITLWHVLEHLPNAFEVLKEIKRILKKGGVLLMAVPNFESLERKLTKDKWYHFDIPRHLFHFSPETIGKMLCKADFKILKVRHFELKNWYGFLQSSLNTLGFKKGLIRDWLSGQVEGSKISWKYRVQIYMALVGLPLLSLVVLLLTLFENSVRMGGTIEVYARNDKG